MKINLFFWMGLIFIFVYLIITSIKKSYLKIEKETMDYNDMEKLFFAKMKEEFISYKLLDIYTLLELMMIKSLFISENRPYYVEFENLMSLRPFVHCKNYNNAKIYILEEDYSDSLIVINSYIKNKDLNKYKIKNVFGNILEYIISGWVIPSPHNYLGIDVNYKITSYDKEVNKNIDKIDDMNLIKIGEIQEINNIEINTEGEDFKNDEIWICSKCQAHNQMYLIYCKKCGKIID